MNKQNPILSAVVVVRNDDYGGDFDQRFQNSMNSLCRQTEQFQVAVELVLVYYNPLPDKAAITERIRFPSRSPFFSVRLITVPAEIHAVFLSDEKVKRKPLPVLEFIAKNIGIRRASASFVLSTNADILLDDRFFAFLKRESLGEKYMYRTDRYDFSRFLGNGIYNSGNVDCVYTRFGRFNTRTWIPMPLFMSLVKINGIIGRLYSKLISRVTFLEAFRARFPFVKREELFLTANHYHACGDFTLLAKSEWEKLRGYPEDTFSAMHTDSLLMSAALASGIHEKILPFPVYHQRHINTFEHNAPDYYEDVMFKRLISDSNRMFQERKPLQVNDEHWGLGDVELEEIRIL